jgi:hypothetical protein
MHHFLVRQAFCENSDYEPDTKNPMTGGGKQKKAKCNFFSQFGPILQGHKKGHFSSEKSFFTKGNLN